MKKIAFILFFLISIISSNVVAIEKNAETFVMETTTKAKSILGWEPRADLDELVKDMVEYDLKLARREVVSST